MAKVFNKEVLGTNVAVVCGADKAVSLAEKLFDAGVSTYEDKTDLINNANKFVVNGDYAVNLLNGKYGKKSLYIKKGFKIVKYNDLLIEKADKPVVNGVFKARTVSPTNESTYAPTATPVIETTTKTKNDGGLTMTKGAKTMMEKVFGVMGMVSTEDVRLTTTGKLAFFDKKRDRWLSENDGQLVDNLGLVMDFQGAFAMPIKKDDLKLGDLIVTPAGGYGFVETVEPLKILTKTSSVSTIREVANVLGMDTFFTVIRPIFDNTVEGFNPMLFAMLGDNNGEGIDMKKMMLMNMMGGANGNLDPMTLMMLMGEDADIKEVLLMQMMAKSGNTNPAMAMMMLSDKGFDMKEFMVMQSMTGGQSMNPMMMMLLDDSKDFDMKDMLMMQMMNPAGTAGAGLDMNNPLMMMAMFDKKKGGNGKMKDIMTMMMMTGAMGKNADGTPKTMDMNNPMMMMMLMGDDNADMKDIMMMQAMSGANGGAMDMNNPMVMMMMLGDKKGGKGMDMKDMMMMNMMSGQAGATNGAMNPLMMAMMLKK